jgi:hypothetical protein
MGLSNRRIAAILGVDPETVNRVVRAANAAAEIEEKTSDQEESDEGAANAAEDDDDDDEDEDEDEDQYASHDDELAAALDAEVEEGPVALCVARWCSLRSLRWFCMGANRWSYAAIREAKLSRDRRRSDEDQDLTKTTKERLAYYEALEERAKGKGPKVRAHGS